MHHIGNTLFACNANNEHMHKLGDRPSCCHNHVSQTRKPTELFEHPICKLKKRRVKCMCLLPIGSHKLRPLGPISCAHTSRLADSVHSCFALIHPSQSMQSEPIERTRISTEPQGELFCMATESKGCAQSSKSPCSQSMQQFEPINIIRVLLFDQTAARQQHHMAMVRACSHAFPDCLGSACSDNCLISVSSIEIPSSSTPPPTPIN